MREAEECNLFVPRRETPRLTAAHNIELEVVALSVLCWNLPLFKPTTFCLRNAPLPTVLVPLPLPLPLTLPRPLPRPLPLETGVIAGGAEAAAALATVVEDANGSMLFFSPEVGVLFILPLLAVSTALLTLSWVNFSAGDFLVETTRCFVVHVVFVAFPLLPFAFESFLQ